MGVGGGGERQSLLGALYHSHIQTQLLKTIILLLIIIIAHTIACVETHALQISQLARTDGFFSNFLSTIQMCLQIGKTFEEKAFLNSWA